jgi:hypothetical protein
MPSVRFCARPSGNTSTSLAVKSVSRAEVAAYSTTRTGPTTSTSVRQRRRGRRARRGAVPRRAGPSDPKETPWDCSRPRRPRWARGLADRTRRSVGRASRACEGVQLAIARQRVGAAAAGQIEALRCARGGHSRSSRQRSRPSRRCAREAAKAAACPCLSGTGRTTALRSRAGHIGLRPKSTPSSFAAMLWGHGPIRIGDAGVLRRRCVGVQIALHEIVEPSAHREHRHADLVELLAHADGFPKRIVGGMRHGFLEHTGRLPGSRHVGGAQRQVQHELGEIGMEMPGARRFSDIHSRRWPSFMAPPGE